MGTYVTEKWEINRKTGAATHTTDHGGYGLITTTIYQAVAVFEVRKNCFCCSCPSDEFSGMDAYCRNHGFAGVRPCTDHDMPGQKDDEDVMPLSVQRQRSINEEKRITLS